MEEDMKFTQTKTPITKNKSKKDLFKVLCPKCKNEKGDPIVVKINKEKELLKECKAYKEESQKKYSTYYAIKRAIINGCPYCKSTLMINCGAYADFYAPKKSNKKEK